MEIMLSLLMSSCLLFILKLTLCSRIRNFLWRDRQVRTRIFFFSSESGSFLLAGFAGSYPDYALFDWIQYRDTRLCPTHSSKNRFCVLFTCLNFFNVKFRN